MPSETDPAAVTHVRAVVQDAVGRLTASGARDEALAEFVPARRVMLISRGATMRPIGRVWRLGVFLLGSDGTLYETGSITRAVEPGRSNYQSVSGEQRREFRIAATRAGFTPGETVNFAATPITLAPSELPMPDSPLVIVDGRARVRWARTAGDDAAVDFDAYLTERVELAVHPPEGA